MIFDSTPWRDELLTVADRLEGRKTQRRWTERTNFLVERDIMVSAYAIRRLMEARKISDSLSTQKVTVKRCDLIGPVPDMYNSQEFWKSFDLEKEEEVQLTIIALCNQVIHSWVWVLSTSKEEIGIDGIYVSSDRARRKHLYFVSLDVLIDLFRSIGDEDVIAIRMQRDESGEMHIVSVES